VVGSLRWALREVGVHVLGQRAILEGVSAHIIGGQGVDLDLVHLGANEVVEGSVLPPRLALMPIVDLIEAHAGGHIFTLDAIDHALVEGVARVCLQRH